jgi:hypothetical protein
MYFHAFGQFLRWISWPRRSQNGMVARTGFQMNWFQVPEPHSLLHSSPSWIVSTRASQSRP